MTAEELMKVLSTVEDPELARDIVALQMVQDLRWDQGTVSFTLVLTTPACPMKDELEKRILTALRTIPEFKALNLTFSAKVRGAGVNNGKLSVPASHLVAVNSGKGGVGKSTVSVNLAVSLAMEGARVGLLDGDIYGPSIPTMMKLGNWVPTSEKITPPQSHGVWVMSLGFLVPDGQAMVWRGPMIHGALRQLFTEVAWPELDYLIVDLPPGTGDAQMSLAQTVHLSGTVNVTGPQTVSLADARRGVSAMEKLQVPLLGIVETMSGEIFGTGGGEVLAYETGCQFLGRIPLDHRVRSGGDSGDPIVVSHPDSEAALAFREIARQVAASLSRSSFGE